jgi:holo-[acyl-carrier protein] synthase
MEAVGKPRCGISSRARELAPCAAHDHNSGMPIIGHGIDIVEIDRIARLVRDHGGHFLDRCFTPAEQAYCLPPKRSHEHLAGRFAVKEAILKVLGTGWRGQIAWTDMEILNDGAGKPILRLTGETARLAAEQGIARWHISISHTDHHATASAIGEGE